MKRTLEMAICYSDGTWQAEHFVEVDDPGEYRTWPDCCGAQDEGERLEKLGEEALQAQWDAVPHGGQNVDGVVGPAVVAVWLYHYEDEVEEEDEARSQVACVLKFDQGKVTEGSEIEQHGRVGQPRSPAGALRIGCKTRKTHLTFTPA